MKHQPLTQHECDQNIAKLREWWRNLDSTQSGQFQLGRLMTLSWNLSKGVSVKGMTSEDLSDIGWMSYSMFEYLMMNAYEVNEMNEDLK
jgi:hypothetical protein